MGEEDDIDLGQGYVELVKANRRAAAYIDEQLLIASLNQCTRAEAVWIGIRRSSAKQRDTEIIIRCLHRPRKGQAENCRQDEPEGFMHGILPKIVLPVVAAVRVGRAIPVTSPT